MRFKKKFRSSHLKKSFGRKKVSKKMRSGKRIKKYGLSRGGIRL